jgi:kinesin family protein 3/17
VYDAKTQQKFFYEDCCFNLVENVLEGFNGTVFAYGQTGCGKSYTMQGPRDADAEGRGVIPNSFSHIFDTVKASTEVQYLIHCSYLEIYQEEIKDLLADPSKFVKGKPAKCDLKEDPQKGVFVKGLTDVVVKDEAELSAVLDRGVALRTVASTQMNDESSRSHSIFTIIVEMSSTYYVLLFFLFSCLSLSLLLPACIL